MSEATSLAFASCPLPIFEHKQIVLGHGSGGKLTAELIEKVFLPAFGNPVLNKLDDQAVVQIGDSRLSFTTDSFVVTPIFFPGGDIGRLAVNGTVNDLAMSGARPLYLATAFILEEGLPAEDLHLKIGAFSGVEKEALEFSYGLACEGTPLEGSRLMVEDVPLRIYCPACRAESPPLSSYQLACPTCHTPAERVTQGKELELKAFEVAA